MASENESSVEKRQDNVIVSHGNIIEPIFGKHTRASWMRSPVYTQQSNGATPSDMDSCNIFYLFVLFVPGMLLPLYIICVM